MTPTAASAEAGPSRPTRVAFTSSASAQSHGEPTNDDLIDIPSTGLDFFHYRRALFLAAAPLPPNPSSRAELPSTYTVTRPPPALPPIRPAKHKNVERLEKLLKPPGAEESYEVWEKGIRGIWQSLDSGKHLKHGLRLGLVVKILRAGWLQDGTWPTDPKTNRALPPPASPLIPSPPVPIDPYSVETKESESTRV